MRARSWGNSFAPASGSRLDVSHRKVFGQLASPRNLFRANDAGPGQRQRPRALGALVVNQVSTTSPWQSM